MKFLIKTFIAIICISSITFAQEELTLEQVILNPSELSPKKLKQLKWIPETDNFSYVETSGDNQRLISESINGDTKDVLIQLSELNNILKDTQLQAVANLSPIFLVQRFGDLVLE